MARAYGAAKRAGIVEPGDVAGVIKALACSPAWAYRLTEEDRDSALTARDQAISEMHAEGKTHRQIGKDLGISTRTLARVLSGQISTVEICPPSPDAGRIDGRRLSAEQIKTLHRGEWPFSEWPPLRKDGTRISKPELFDLFLSLSPEELSLMGVLLKAASEAQYERFRFVVERLRAGLDADGEEVDALDPDTLSEMRYFVDHHDEIYEYVLAESTDSADWGFVDNEAIGRAARGCMARVADAPEVMP
jgi:hypothetical protein